MMQKSSPESIAAHKRNMGEVRLVASSARPARKTTVPLVPNAYRVSRIGGGVAPAAAQNPREYGESADPGSGRIVKLLYSRRGIEGDGAVPALGQHDQEVHDDDGDHTDRRRLEYFHKIVH